MTTALAPVQTIQFDISDGPNIDRIVDCFKYAYDADTVLNTTFSGLAHIADGTSQYMEYEAQIMGLRYESGQPGMFIITVNIKNFKTTQGFYNAKTRKGRLSLERNN